MHRWSRACCTHICCSHPPSSPAHSHPLRSADSVTRRARKAAARIVDFEEAASKPAAGGGVLPSASAAFTEVDGPPAFLDPEVGAAGCCLVMRGAAWLAAEQLHGVRCRRQAGSLCCAAARTRARCSPRPAPPCPPVHAFRRRPPARWRRRCTGRSSTWVLTAARCPTPGQPTSTRTSGARPPATGTSARWRPSSRSSSTWLVLVGRALLRGRGPRQWLGGWWLGNGGGRGCKVRPGRRPDAKLKEQQ